LEFIDGVTQARLAPASVQISVVPVIRGDDFRLTPVAPSVGPDGRRRCGALDQHVEFNSIEPAA
jgi:hypothetical protein